jgi:hypothetical protein
MNEKAPIATFIEVRGKYAKIRCPYCAGIHEHNTMAVPFRPGTTHRRAPGCGLARTGAERVTGYTFTVPTA